MSTTACANCSTLRVPSAPAERVLDDGLLARGYELVIGIEPALQAMKIREQNPRAFVQRMAGMMKWMGKAGA